jgi:preprotein translocase subunit YajC
MSFWISNAFAAGEEVVSQATAVPANTAQTAPPSNPLSSSLFLIVIFAVFLYLFLWRPQSKRVKAHQSMIEQLQIDDEIITSGGLVGKIKSMENNRLQVAINENTLIHIQKNSVTTVLPKGSTKF